MHCSGYRFLGKRSANAKPAPEANADSNANPQWWGYGWPYYNSYGYSLIGKRSADAEPEATADPKANPQWWGGYYPYNRYPYYFGKK